MNGFFKWCVVICVRLSLCVVWETWKWWICSYWKFSLLGIQCIMFSICWILLKSRECHIQRWQSSSISQALLGKMWTQVIREWSDVLSRKYFSHLGFEVVWGQRTEMHVSNEEEGQKSKTCVLATFHCCYLLQTRDGQLAFALFTLGNYTGTCF